MQGRSVLAAEIAALLEERDPMAALESDASLTTRLDALRRAGRSGRWGRIAQMAEQYRALAEKSAPKIAKNGADPDIKDQMGMSAYGYATLFKKTEIVEILKPFHKE